MTYEVYAGGIHAVQAQLKINTDEISNQYDVVLTAKTRGLLGKLAPWHGTFESHGKVKQDKFLPLMHRSTTTWRDEDEVKTYRYNLDGTFAGLTIKDHDKPAYTKKPDAALTDHTTDALTATLQALAGASDKQNCSFDADVFDGKRRFEQKFVQQDSDPLQASRYNAYAGAAQLCTVEIAPKGGAWHKKPRGWMSIQEQGRAQGTMPSVWMAQLHQGLPAVPVKIKVKTDYGTLFMHLTRYHYQDTILLAEKRDTDADE